VHSRRVVGGTSNGSHAHREVRAERAERPHEVPADPYAWARHGVAAGVLGAVTVALFFFVLDWMRGQPFWTPHALGTALFRGEAVPLGGRPEPAIVAGNTVLHGTVFVALALLASTEVFLQRRVPLDTVGFAVLAVLFFAACEAIFLTFSAIFDPALLEKLGGGFVAAANLLAALLMAGYLVAAGRHAFGRRAAPRPGPKDP